MGNYAEFYVGNFHADSTKNGLNHDLVSFFDEGDLEVYEGRASTIDSRVVDWFDEEPDDFEIVYLRAPVERVTTIFDIRGYTLTACVQNFEACILEKAKLCRQYEAQWKDSSPELSHLKSKEAELLESLTYDSWIGSLREIEAGKYDTAILEQGEDPDSLPPVVAYILRSAHYGYPGDSYWVGMRLLLEAVEAGGTCLYDLTGLVDTYYEVGEDIFDPEQYRYPVPFELHAKTIVLTEGATDSDILKQALDIMYPHLSKYYSFLDFESSGYGGGVGPLASTVKALAGSGIENRVIALFDNDSAAHDAVRSLDQSSLPENIRILFLPDIDTLREYPTIGPTGRITANVNGMAGSLELYLGKDILTNDDGQFIPIQWTGYIKALDRYQGTVLDKKSIHAAWKGKVESGGASHFQSSPAYWKDLDSVFTAIFQAFTSVGEASVIDHAQLDPFA